MLPRFDDRIQITGEVDRHSFSTKEDGYAGDFLLEGLFTNRRHEGDVARIPKVDVDDASLPGWPSYSLWNPEPGCLVMASIIHWRPDITQGVASRVACHGYAAFVFEDVSAAKLPWRIWRRPWDVNIDYKILSEIQIEIRGTAAFWRHINPCTQKWNRRIKGEISREAKP